MKETDLMLKVIAAKGWQDLLEVIKDAGEVVSNSRPEPVVWDYNSLCKAIKNLRSGGPINSVTRVAGLRAKTAELHLAKNYGDPIPNEIKTNFED